MTDTTQPIAQLRHLHKYMVNGGVRNADSAKRIAGEILGPAIAALEAQAPAVPAQEPWGYARRLGRWGFCSKREYEEAMQDGDEVAKLYTAPQPEAAVDERAAFETWYAKWHGVALTRRTAHPALYMSDDVNAAWKGWQARAALPAQGGV